MAPSRSTLVTSWGIGLVVSVGSLAVMLAGSGWPPPPGFAFVALACRGLGGVMGRSAPLIERRTGRHGPIPALGPISLAGCAYLAACAALVAARQAPSPGSPVLIAVAGVVGALGGRLGGAVTLLLRPRDAS